MLMGVTVGRQAYWYAARASGILTWALATISIVWGLMLSTRIAGRNPTGPWLLDLHRFVGGLAVVFLGVHISAIVADTYIHFGWKDILIPLHGTWHPVAVGYGIVAMYLLVAVELTSLGMKYLPRKLWHYIHLTSFGVYILATFHFLYAGTDAHAGIMNWVIIGSLVIVVFLTIYRLMMPKRISQNPRKTAFDDVRAQLAEQRANRRET